MALGAAFASCGGEVAPPARAATNATASAPPAASTIPHGDHNPHHGGVVMMKGDLHYEVVLDPEGRRHRLYFTDAVREDLPASIASQVSLEVRRPEAPAEAIRLQIDEAGESWAGTGRPVTIGGALAVHVAFTIGGDAYAIDLPYQK